MAGAFLSDIQTLRKRAREHIAQGAVTPGYHADREVVLTLLTEAILLNSAWIVSADRRTCPLLISTTSNCSLLRFERRKKPSPISVVRSSGVMAMVWDCSLPAEST